MIVYESAAIGSDFHCRRRAAAFSNSANCNVVEVLLVYGKITLILGGLFWLVVAKHCFSGGLFLPIVESHVFLMGLFWWIVESHFGK